MTNVYVVFYIHTDASEYSEVLGVFQNKESAVKELLERANYREDKHGNLTQYMSHTSEYESYNILYDQVMKDMELYDGDIYRITKCIVV